MFLESNIDNSKITFMIENKRVKSRSEVKLLGIATDDKLSFTTHIENLCSTASKWLEALAKCLSEAYIVSTFTHWPLIWMFCSKTANILINKVHKRSTRVIYEMADATFENLLTLKRLEGSIWPTVVFWKIYLLKAERNPGFLRLLILS